MTIVGPKVKKGIGPVLVGQSGSFLKKFTQTVFWQKKNYLEDHLYIQCIL